MKVEITWTRTFEMDAQRVLTEPGFAPPPPSASPREKQSWLRESFYELNGFEREQDHVDGSYVHLVDESEDAEFEWPEALR